MHFVPQEGRYTSMCQHGLRNANETENDWPCPIIKGDAPQSSLLSTRKGGKIQQINFSWTALSNMGGVFSTLPWHYHFLLCGYLESVVGELRLPLWERVPAPLI